uniref:Thioredoxin domain-containing protein n=1 Tax=viral metagenome TaxID=1070528 RepID=A0A6C0JIW0_9ZZZZ
MKTNIEKMFMKRVKVIENILKPKNIPRLLLIIAILLVLYYFYTTYLIEGMENSELSPADFSEVLNNKNGKTMLLVYADWCGHCKSLKPIWSEASSEVNKDNQKMYMVNCGGDSEDEKKIMKDYSIDGFPTILIFNNGTYEKTYTGERTKEGLMNEISS